MATKRATAKRTVRPARKRAKVAAAPRKSASICGNCCGGGKSKSRCG